MTSSLSDATDKAQLHALSSPHSSDWLNALPLSGCGLRLDDHAIHIAVDLRLGASIQYVSLASALAERPLTQEDCKACRAYRGQRSLCEAPQPERPGVASERRHSGVKGAVRPAQN